MREGKERERARETERAWEWARCVCEREVKGDRKKERGCVSVCAAHTRTHTDIFCLFLSDRGGGTACLRDRERVCVESVAVCCSLLHTHTHTHTHTHICVWVR